MKVRGTAARLENSAYWVAVQRGSVTRDTKATNASERVLSQ